MTPKNLPAGGGCSCRAVRYELTRAPLFVHCCHCRWCQRETGSAFVINAMVEADCINLIAGDPVAVDTPSESGKGQKILRCPTCHVALWSHYAGAGPRIAFLRAGTLDDPDACPPDIHIYTSSKQPWVTLSHDVPVVKEYYRRSEYWPEDAIQRLKIAREG